VNGYNFTERVRRVLMHAREQAVGLGHEYVGTEHILLGLCADSGVANAAMTNLALDPPVVRDRVLEIVKRGSAHMTGPDLPYTSRAKKSLELAMAEARSMSHSYVGTEHLLLGILLEEKNIAAQVLASLGATVPRVRDEVLRLLGPGERT
jgi:ATP-dependent Clp protease ATP-binding subunit ClpC